MTLCATMAMMPDAVVAPTAPRNDPRPRVTLFSRSFPPAYLRGGPGRTVAGMVETLAGEIDFSVVTWAYDDPALPMMDVATDDWVPALGARVVFLSAQRPSARRLAALLRQSGPDLVVLNSLLDARFSILEVLLLRLSGRCPVLLAPQGELSQGALALKSLKKRVFLRCFRLARLHRFVAWHATTEMEAADIRRVMGDKVVVHVTRPVLGASDCRLAAPGVAPHHSAVASTSIVYFSRVAPKKNLTALLAALADVQGRVTLTIAGPIENEGYWAECVALISRLPSSVEVAVHGAVPAAEVVPFLTGFDLFVLPTLGENFGHAVLEALLASVPVIVGHDTPWQAVQECRAGWLCDPTDIAALTELLQRFVGLRPEEREQMRCAAKAVADRMVAAQPVSATRMMLLAAAARRR